MTYNKWKVGRMEGWEKNTRKNINRGYRQLTVWQDAVAYYVLTCKILNRFLTN